MALGSEASYFAPVVEAFSHASSSSHCPSSAPFRSANIFLNFLCISAGSYELSSPRDIYSAIAGALALFVTSGNQSIVLLFQAFHYVALARIIDLISRRCTEAYIAIPLPVPRLGHHTSRLLDLNCRQFWYIFLRQVGLQSLAPQIDDSFDAWCGRKPMRKTSGLVDSGLDGTSSKQRGA
ncbi:hypothetical protein EJB05_31055, partial [Eragrostis curvula]